MIVLLTTSPHRRFDQVLGACLRKTGPVPWRGAVFRTGKVKNPAASSGFPWLFPMEKRYRLKRNADFQRAHRQGQSWANKLLVLVAVPNSLDHSRFGFSASRWLGKAVVRNRAKRLMREVVRRQKACILAGWDMVWIARRPMREADFPAVERAVEQLLRRARLLKEKDGLSESSKSST